MPVIDFPGPYLVLLSRVITPSFSSSEAASVRMVHDGFVSPNNDMGYEAMSRGWASVVKRIGELAAEL